MPVPSLSLAPTRPSAAAGDRLGLFVVSSSDGPVVLGRDVDQGLLAELKVTGAADQVVRLPGGVLDDSPVILAGVGGVRSAPSLRAAAGSASRAAAGDARLILDAGAADDGELTALLEGAALGAYSFSGRPHRGDDSSPVPEVIVVGSPNDPGALSERASVVTEAVTLSRDLANTPPSQQSPADLAQSALDAVAGLPIDVKIWDERELAADGFGGILGVGSGSTRPPRLVRVDYAPTGSAGHIALVGKGITFDSGGLSLKPPVPMVGMKYDMAGAASVLAVVVAAARLALPVHVTGWLCVAENMPSGSAIRPNDVLTIRGGTTVEVLNTDAEGRLVLADGLRAAGEERPDAIIDIATLTGAEVVAFGTRYSAVMGDDTLVGSVRDAAEHSGELLWPMPLPAELRASLKTEVADIANANPGNTAGGMLLAGVFLREFVGKTSDEPAAKTIPWAHLDIAGSAQNNGAPYGYAAKGATGVLVRTLIRVAEGFRAR
ncbi:leucyl aminopeptidase [Humibacter sp. RRB41]|uniref:leucyl aminopeptidase n=1 Tax=Humibacter sp. RRB41 TaxID=2919946 RepID=UPI001FAB1F79|nr:leucyl aminopeptidase [Humibacter sp. RRB41]